MILPQTSGFVLTLLVMSMLCLGAWPTLFKATGKWRFELFYFDFAFGLLLAALICSFTFGDLGYDGFSFVDDLQHAGKRQWLFCFLAGIIFNLGNMLLLGAISISSVTIAYPITMGVAILISAALGFMNRSSTSPALVIIGCGLILTSVVVSSIAYRITGVLRHEELARAGLARSTRRPSPMKGIIVALSGGLLIGSMGGLLARSREADIGLGPYSAAALFAGGVFFSSFVFNIFLMNLPLEGQPLEFGTYFKGTLAQHLTGMAGGAIWFAGIAAAMVATSAPEAVQPSPVLRVLLGQAAPVVGAILGIAIWHELKQGDMRVKILAFLMLILFTCGLTMIGLAPAIVARG